MLPEILLRDLFVFAPTAGVSVLAEDTSLVCGEGDWTSSALVALVAIGLFCFGLPFAFWSIARTGHSGSAAHRRLVHTLTWIYNDDCWFMESVDLMRKFFLTGLVPIVWRDQRAQVQQYE